MASPLAECLIASEKNRIILLANGKIAADATFQELKEESGEGTLEEIFNQFTVTSNQENIVENFVANVLSSDGGVEDV